MDTVRKYRLVICEHEPSKSVFFVKVRTHEKYETRARLAIKVCVTTPLNKQSLPARKAIIRHITSRSVPPCKMSIENDDWFSHWKLRIIDSLDQSLRFIDELKDEHTEEYLDRGWVCLNTI